MAMATYADGAGDRGPEWERVLWRPQPFPDNYVPPTFLAALSKNRNQFFFLLLLSKIPKSFDFLQLMYFRIDIGHSFWAHARYPNTSPSSSYFWPSSLGCLITRSTRVCWSSSLARPLSPDVSSGDLWNISGTIRQKPPLLIVVRYSEFFAVALFE
jgi:hypothetical protein